jgi:2'-5' RNA ligase
MITHYIADVSQWPDWGHEYRFGVLLIFPPAPLRAQVNALRAEHDPASQAACDAHISLTTPLARPIGAADWRELEAIAGTIEPFAIHYGPLLQLGHVVCLAIELHAALDRLRVALESAAVFTGAPARIYPFLPHMTIAEFITAEQSARLMRELADIVPSGSFPCTGVDYAVPDANFHFTERGRLSLGRLVTASHIRS